MDDDIAIKVEGVYKNFILPHQKTNSVKSIFTNMFAIGNRTYETQHALKDISFEVKKGEFFGIVGRNGSGKSTLLKILAGIYQPTKGRVKTKGRIVPFIELGVGFNPELTGRENVYLNGALLGFSEIEVTAKYEDIVDFAEISRFMDQKLKNYSSGMQVRLAFSMAIRAKADILLIDEVLAVGDADFQRKCFDFFRKLKREHTTVVFVSHDMDAVREYCDRAILLESSQLICEGNSNEVSAKYTRLFTEKELDVNEKTTDKQNRWGNKRALIEKPKVTITNDKQTIKIEAIIRASNCEINNSILGFTIKSPSGESITGTNTKIMQTKLGQIKAGEAVKYVFEMDNILNNGVHSLNLAVLGEDGITVYDWWEDSTKFRIYKERPVPYLINPGITFTKINMKE